MMATNKRRAIDRTQKPPYLFHGCCHYCSNTLSACPGCRYMQGDYTLPDLNPSNIRRHLPPGYPFEPPAPPTAEEIEADRIRDENDRIQAEKRKAEHRRMIKLAIKMKRIENPTIFDKCKVFIVGVFKRVKDVLREVLHG